MVIQSEPLQDMEVIMDIIQVIIQEEIWHLLGLVLLSKEKHIQLLQKKAGQMKTEMLFHLLQDTQAQSLVLWDMIIVHQEIMVMDMNILLILEGITMNIMATVLTRTIIILKMEKHIISLQE